VCRLGSVFGRGSGLVDDTLYRGRVGVLISLRFGVAPLALRRRNSSADEIPKPCDAARFAINAFLRRRDLD
jgi:hypothetical protein